MASVTNLDGGTGDDLGWKCHCEKTSRDFYGMKTDFQMILMSLGVHSKCLVHRQRKHAYQDLVLFWEQKAR